jgi:hypothetical protein
VLHVPGEPTLISFACVWSLCARDPSPLFPPSLHLLLIFAYPSSLRLNFRSPLLTTAHLHAPARSLSSLLWTILGVRFSRRSNFSREGQRFQTGCRRPEWAPSIDTRPQIISLAFTLNAIAKIGREFCLVNHVLLGSPLQIST